MKTFRRGALFIAAVLAAPAAAQVLPVQVLTAPTGQWYQVFAPEIERVIGRSVRVDALSVAAGGLGRTFRQAEVLLWASGQYPRGTTLLSERTVDCTGGRVATTQWQVFGPTGAALGTFSGSGVQRINWDSQDGKVLRFICQGILPR